MSQSTEQLLCTGASSRYSLRITKSYRDYSRGINPIPKAVGTDAVLIPASTTLPTTGWAIGLISQF